MKLFWILFLIVVVATTSFGQNAAPTPALYSDATITDLVRLQHAAVASDYAYNQVGYLSNNIGPRLTGSPQAARAVEYVADQMRKLGLDVRLQKCMVPHWVRGAEHGELVEWQGM